MKYILQGTLIFLLANLMATMSQAQGDQLIVSCPDSFVKEECCATPTEDPFYGIAVLQLPAASTKCIRQNLSMIWLLDSGNIMIDPNNVPVVEGFMEHDISILVTDACGNSIVCNYRITISRPELIFEFDPCPSDTTIYVSVGEEGAMVEYDLPVFESNCPPPTNFSIFPDPSPASGSLFPLGTTTLSFRASNFVCGEALCAFSIIVEEASISIECPENIIKEEEYPDSPSPEFGVAEVVMPSATTTCPTNDLVSVALLDSENYTTDADGTITVTGFETHTVRFELSDACGNVDTCSYTITITRPEIEIGFVDCPTDTIVITLEEGQIFAENVYEIPDVTSNCFFDFEYYGETSNKGTEAQYYPGFYVERYILNAPCGGGICNIYIDVQLDGPLVAFIDCPEDYTKTELFAVAPADDPLYGLAKIEEPELFAACEFGQDIYLAAPSTTVLIDGDRYVSGFQTHDIVFIGVGNGCGVIDSCAYSITIERPEAAFISTDCPEDILKEEAYPESPSPEFGVAEIVMPIATTTCPTDTVVTVTLLDSENYTVGFDGIARVSGFETHTVRFELRDACGSVDTCSYTITITRPEVEIRFVDCPTDTIVILLEEGQRFAEDVYELPDVTSNCFFDFEYYGETSNKGTEAQYYPGFYVERYILNAPCGGGVCDIYIDVRLDGPLVAFIDCPEDYTKTELFPTAPADDPLYGLAKIEVPELFAACEFGQDIYLVAPSTPVLIDGEQYVSGFQTHDVVFIGVGNNGCGTIDSCTYSITIERPEPIFQFMNCPNDTIINVVTGEDGVFFEYNNLLLESNCPSVDIVAEETNIGSGGFFPVGTNRESFTATGECGEIICAFNVIVVAENTTISVDCPDSFVKTEDPVSAGQSDYGIAFIEFPSALTACTNPEVSIELLNEEIVFLEGQAAIEGFQVHDIVFRITDNCGNLEICNYTIEIVRPDLEFEIGVCPEDILIRVPMGITGATVNYDEPQIVTNCPGEISLDVRPPGVLRNGDFFPVGTTTLTYVFSSVLCEKIISCEFNITIVEDETMEEGIDLELFLLAEDAPLERYREGEFRFVLSNKGTDIATGIEMQLNYNPNEVVPVGSWSPQASKGVYRPVSKKWMIDELAPGETVTLDIKMFAKMAGASFFGEVSKADQMDIDSSPNNAVCCEAIEDDEVYFKAQIIEPPFLITCPEDFTQAYVLPVNEDDPFFGKAVIIYPEAVSTSCADTSVNIELLTTENIGEMNGMPVVEGFQEHTLDFRITDQCGHADTCTYTIKVSMPNLYHRFAYCPEDIIVKLPAGESSSIVHYSTPIFQTNCPDEATVTQLPNSRESGSAFPLGVSTITYIANSSCEIDTCSFDVIVEEESASPTDIETYLHVNRGEIRAFEPNPIRFTIYNNSEVDATGVRFKLNIQADYLVQVGNNPEAVSQGDYTNFTGLWNVGTVSAGDSANLWMNLFLAKQESTTIYAQIISVNELDIDSTPSNGSCCIANEDDEIAFTVIGDLSIDYAELRDSKAKEMVRVYPNPTSHQLNIEYPVESGATSYSIFDLNGRLIKTVPLYPDVNISSIDISALQNGVYYLKLNADTVQVPIRFVKL